VLCPALVPPGTRYASVPGAGALRIEPGGALHGITPRGEIHPMAVGGLRRDDRPVALAAGPRGAVALVCQSPRLAFVLALFAMDHPGGALVVRDIPVMPLDHWCAHHAFDAAGLRFAYAHYPNQLGWLDLARRRAAVFPGSAAPRWAPIAVGIHDGRPAALAEGVLRSLDPSSGRWDVLGELPTYVAVHPRPRRAAVVACHAQARLGPPCSSVTWRDVGGAGGTLWVRDELTAARVLDDGLLVAFGRHAWVLDADAGTARRLGAHTAPRLFDGAIARHGAAWRLWPAVPGLPCYLEFPSRTL
jgi:hypothetical protein